jgi:hypothetical protein
MKARRVDCGLSLGLGGVYKKKLRVEWVGLKPTLLGSLLLMVFISNGTAWDVLALQRKEACVERSVWVCLFFFCCLFVREEGE